MNRRTSIITASCRDKATTTIQEFRIRGDKPWGKNLVKYDGMHVTDAITDITLDWLKTGRDEDKPFFLMHHYKAPHDYFENAERYETYLADVEIRSRRVSGFAIEIRFTGDSRHQR
ncbi:MAG: sulfatase-like hydrolase/transferase [Planctomycetaceae bacterium]